MILTEYDEPTLFDDYADALARRAQYAESSCDECGQLGVCPAIRHGKRAGVTLCESCHYAACRNPRQPVKPTAVKAPAGPIDVCIPRERRKSPAPRGI
jgi:hypothetical protein